MVVHDDDDDGSERTTSERVGGFGLKLDCCQISQPNYELFG